MPVKIKTLEEILKAESKQRKYFPNGLDYYSIYNTFAEFLDREVHKNVGVATMHRNGSFLTDHGPDHIATVARRAADLLGPKPLNYISRYELFILLTAIQVHDAGHVKSGREGHEKAANELLNELKVTTLERRIIFSVAKVHGGRVNGDKDTINQINAQGKAGSETVNVHFLAALLRFSDELADDHNRAANYLLQTSDILGYSKIFHAYASTLTVDVNRGENEVHLSFQLTRAMTIDPYAKEVKDENNNTVVIQQFILEEIYERTFKMYTECIYCMRFFPSELQVKSIGVTITAFDKDEYTPLYNPFKYTLRERGYPTLVAKSVMDMCANDLTILNQRLTGAFLKHLVENSIAIQ